MFKSKTRIPAIVCVLCLLCACGGNGNNGLGNTNPSNNEGGTTSGVVSGVVLDNNGAPIPGVTITAYHTNNNIGVSTTTDATGAYSFTSLYTGNWTDYQIFAGKTGFGFYPSVSGGTGGILKAGYNGLERVVIHYATIPTTPLTGTSFTAFRPGDRVVSIPRTGQTTSYVRGDDTSANKGVTWPGLRFIDNKDGTATDRLTGLVWMKNAGCFAPSNWSAALNSANLLASGQCGLTDGSTAGQWRMPNVNELESLVDISQSNPAVSGGSPFTNIAMANAYWSSSSYMAASPFNFANLGGAPSSAMAIRFTDGRWVNGTDALPYSNDKVASVNSLWAVRSGLPGVVNLQATGLYYTFAVGDDAYHTCPFCEGTVNGSVDTPVAGDSASLVNSKPLTSPRMIDNGDGTLYDTVTGLTWLKKADCISASWTDAITAANNLASGQCGLTDGSAAGQWRMPNRFEMLSLADRAPTFAIAAYYNGIYGPDGITVTGPVVFNMFAVSQYYWTSSTYTSDSTQAWTVYSCDFGVYNTPKSAIGYTMAVR